MRLPAEKASQKSRLGGRREESLHHVRVRLALFGKLSLVSFGPVPFLVGAGSLPVRPLPLPREVRLQAIDEPRSRAVDHPQRRGSLDRHSIGLVFIRSPLRFTEHLKELGEGNLPLATVPACLGLWDFPFTKPSLKGTSAHPEQVARLLYRKPS